MVLTFIQRFMIEFLFIGFLKKGKIISYNDIKTVKKGSLTWDIKHYIEFGGRSLSLML
ncbi:hypothetical protein JOC77_004261 [Peribacillus deserti]|uniref:Uncharacterized protein n=1 Tax=Peribacillus deserti TaxID=673318 RepID=A0ABS2QPX4_9BACI|nr:hypothetical protein [Peribacillus deserti]